MQTRILRTLALLPSAFLFNGCATAEEKAIVHESGYVEESPLPEGYPMPGPYNEVSRKSYPAYRAAVTDTDGPNRGFMTLFRHIKRQDIAMTSPVEMTMADKGGDNMEMEQMAFLYRHTKQGQTGMDGDKVEVRDLPKMDVLSYAWLGSRDQKSVTKAKTLLLEEATKKGLKHKGFRLLGYNSPFIPDARKTHELQLILE